jgi:magnesium-transporting ATPase (P-type)
MWKFIKNQLNPFSLLLIGAGSLSFIAQTMLDSNTLYFAIQGSVLLLVVLITMVVSYYQERKRKIFIAKFSILITNDEATVRSPSYVKVIRDGQQKLI